MIIFRGGRHVIETMLLRVLISELVLALTILLPKSDSATILAAFGRADVYAEKAYGYYCNIHNFLLSEYQSGKTDIEKEDWEEKVIPWAEKVVMNMNQAIAEVESVMPGDIKTEFWKDVYYDVWQSWKLDTEVFRKMDFYQSEYTMKLAGYPNYLHMYLAITDSKFNSILRACGKLQALAKELR